MARERLTEEFVQHYDNVVKLTTDNPNGLVSALDEYRGLGDSLKRLGEILLLVHQHRKYTPHRYIREAPSGFREALKDFEERWTGPYNECRDRSYTQALNEIAQEFLWRYHLVVERTGNAPTAAEQLRETDTKLNDAIHELAEIRRALDDSHPEFGRYIDRAPDELREALADLNERWMRIKLCLLIGKADLGLL